MSNADTPADQTGGNTAAPASSRLGELPPRIRVHALAKLLGQSSRDLLAKLAELGESPRSAASSVTREVAHRVAEALDPAGTDPTGATPAAPGTPPATDEATARAGQPTESGTAGSPATSGTEATGTVTSGAVAAGPGSVASGVPTAGVPTAGVPTADASSADAPGAATSGTGNDPAATTQSGSAESATGPGAGDVPAATTAADPQAAADTSDQSASTAGTGRSAGRKSGSGRRTGGKSATGRAAAARATDAASETTAEVGTAGQDTAESASAGDRAGTAADQGTPTAEPTTPGDPAAGEPDGAGSSTAGQAGETAAPEKSGRTGSRRSRRAVAPAIPAEQQETEQATAARGPVHVPVFAAPSPVFLPPEETAAQPSRNTPEAVFGVGDEPVKSGKRSKRAESSESAEAEDTAGEDGERSDEDGDDPNSRRRRRRGRRGRGRGKGGDEGSFETSEQSENDEADQGGKPGDKAAKPDKAEKEDKSEQSAESDSGDDADSDGGTKRRRRRRRRKGGDDDAPETTGGDDPPNTVTHVRQAKAEPERAARDEVRSVRGSTRLEAKRQRRRDGREAGRRRAPILSEAEFLARRESVERTMVVAEKGDSTQIGVLEDGVLVEHFVTQSGTGSIVGNVYLGRVQNVLPSMEAAFIDIGRGRNAVLYAGEVDWDAAGLEGKARKIEQALSTGDSVLVQVTKDPVGHKGARLTTQISLPGRFLVYVPAGGATGISRKLPENERRRLKDILKRIVPEDAGVIIRTASEGISEQELDRDVRRLKAQWDIIKDKAAAGSGKKGSAPAMLYEEPDLLVKVVRDLFTEDFAKLEVQGGKAWDTIHGYVQHVAPDLIERLKRYTGTGDAFAAHRIDEQITKALDRKVWLPSGGYLVIDRTEAMTVIDVNTGKFTGSGGNLEETVTRNNLESAEEIVRQLRLRDIGGIIVIDFIDMVLESNRELVLRRLTECLGRDRTRHQVAEVTSLGLVQMTRKKIGTGLLEAFSTPCEHCKGRGVVVSTEQPQRGNGSGSHNGHNHGSDTKASRRSRGRGKGGDDQHSEHQAKAEPVTPAPTPEQRESVVTAVQAMANASKAASARGEHEQPATDEAAGEPTATESGRKEGSSSGETGNRSKTTEAGPRGAVAGTSSGETAGRSEAAESKETTVATGTTAITGTTGNTATAEPAVTTATAEAEPGREVAGQPVTTPADEAEVRPQESPARPAGEVADAPVTTPADEVVVPQSEPSVEPSSPEPETPEDPATSKASAAAVTPETPVAGSSSAGPDADAEPEVEVPAPAGRSGRRRSRRAASRPAGPPVHATDQS
ncbi:translation initiation factor IF-2 N-terminal domain-containing protein [Amycolatopsis jiangsuensis]|uniref:Ribonuclease E n=1 Tax=Amycolatopsis jiangsuensis TaxID=1181879 RepID=A0A840J8P8_9PSEU|nr:translation initiation factor IF-2 N-terminal domain-containing protein [Amycolatopsis jiangsuensis]MBB4689768.1 ribonuclease E [Amycolatopsis jiangsuensis]